MSNFDDSMTDRKLRVRAFNRSSNRQFSTHVAKVMAESNDRAKLIDLVEISRSVVKSSNFDPWRSKFGKFEFFILIVILYILHNYAIIMQ